MVRILPRHGSGISPGRMFALSLLVLAHPAHVAAATLGQSESAVVGSAKLIRAAVAQTDAAIAGRVRALSGGRMTSPLALTPDRHVRVLALGNAGAPLPSPRDDEARAVAAKNGIPLANRPVKTPIGIWVDGAWSRLRFKNNGTPLDGEMWSGLAGIDYALNARLIFGLAGGYENQNFNTSSMDGVIAGSGVKMAPYAVYRLDDNLSVSASGGYAWLGYADTHEDPLSGQESAGAADTSRWYATTDLNAAYRLDAWHLNSRLGAFYADDGLDSSVDTPASGGQVMAIGDLRLGYWFDLMDGFEPYVSARGRLAYEDGVDDNAGTLLGIGARLDLGSARLDVRGSASNAANAPSAYAGLVNLSFGL
jgi:hypothetical protein